MFELGAFFVRFFRQRKGVTGFESVQVTNGHEQADSVSRLNV